MEAKELKIQVPKGYEIDKENSTFECIKFKPIKKNITYRDICEYLFKDKDSFYITNSGGVNNYLSIDGVLHSENLDCSVVTMAGESYDYKEMLDIYLFADGTPFGIKE